MSFSPWNRLEDESSEVKELGSDHAAHRNGRITKICIPRDLSRQFCLQHSGYSGLLSHNLSHTHHRGPNLLQKSEPLWVFHLCENGDPAIQPNLQRPEYRCLYTHTGVGEGLLRHPSCNTPSNSQWFRFRVWKKKKKTKHRKTNSQLPAAVRRIRTLLNNAL